MTIKAGQVWRMTAGSDRALQPESQGGWPRELRIVATYSGLGSAVVTTLSNVEDVEHVSVESRSIMPHHVLLKFYQVNKQGQDSGPSSLVLDLDG